MLAWRWLWLGLEACNESHTGQPQGSHRLCLCKPSDADWLRDWLCDCADAFCASPHMPETKCARVWVGGWCGCHGAKQG